MKAQNNPAGRLGSILKAANSMNDKSVAAKVAWAEILETALDNIPLLLRRLGQVMELPEVVRQQIMRQKDIDQEVYLKWLPKVQRAFGNTNLKAPLSTFTDPIDEAALDGLDFCADLLSRKMPEKILDKGVLKSIYDDTNKLMEDIVGSDIDKDLKIFMLEKLDQVISAIKEYKIKGANPVEKVVESTYGAIVMHENIYKKTKDTKHGSDFWKILSRVAVVVGITVGSIQIGESIINLLPDTSTDAIEVNIVEKTDTEPEIKPELNE